MGHKIIEAIIEDGQLKHVNKNLPGISILRMVFKSVEK